MESHSYVLYKHSFMNEENRIYEETLQNVSIRELQGLDSDPKYATGFISKENNNFFS